VVREADTEVRMWVETPEGRVEREPTVRVRGSGAADDAGATPEVVVVREPRPGVGAPTARTLVGTWAGQDEPVVLAYLA
jgi:hypothetical protein